MRFIYLDGYVKTYTTKKSFDVHSNTYLSLSTSSHLVHHSKENLKRIVFI